MKLGFGCVNLGSAGIAQSTSEQVRLVRSAIDRGVTTFDTADAYGNGTSERLLGRAIAGRRDQVTLATKGGYRFRARSAPEQWARARVAALLRLRDRRRPATTERDWSARSASGGYIAQDFSAAHLRTAIEASLRRLGTDHLDVFHLHGPDRVDDDVLAQLDDLRQAGTIRAFGIGAESLSSAQAWLQVPQIDQLFIPFGILDPDGAGLIQAAAESGRPVWVRGVLGGGVLTAAARDLDEVAGHPKRATVTGLSSIAEEAGLGLDELAVRWLNRQPGIDTVVVGIGSAGHLDRNTALFDLPALDDDVTAAIDDCLLTTLPEAGRRP